MNSSLCAKQNADAQAQRRLHFSHKSLAKSGHAAETVYGRVDLAINCDPVSKFWGWDSGQLEEDGGSWPGGVGIAHRFVTTKDDPPFHTLLLYCPFAGWPSRGMGTTARGTDGPYPEPLEQRGSVALLEPKLYCGRYSR